MFTKKTNPKQRVRIAPGQWGDWRWQFRNRRRTPGSLGELLSGESAQANPLREVLGVYRWAVTPYYLSLFDPHDEADPLRLQCIPDAREITFSAGGVEDPLEEDAHSPVPGLIRRYRDRCLVTMTNRLRWVKKEINHNIWWESDSGLKIWYGEHRVSGSAYNVSYGRFRKYSRWIKTYSHKGISYSTLKEA